MNELRKCLLCHKVWQTHERNDKVFRCPSCGSTLENHEKLDGKKIFIHHFITQDDYYNLIFGSELGRTWHDTFGKLRGFWVENHHKISIVKH
jgi:hypothetical protein